MRYLMGLLTLLLTGCLSTNPAAWTGHQVEAFTAASYECRMMVNQQGQQAAAFGGAVVPLVYLFTRNGMYKDCMEARGWRQAD